MRLLLLDFAGIIAAIIIGLTVFFFSSNFGIQNFLILLFFLLISVAATKYRHEEKKEKGVYEHERGWQNVLSNGLIPALCCVSYYYTNSIKWIFGFICSLAAATADKFGSELGVLSEKPISLQNLKRVRPGTSGAITPLGTFMSFVGALLISLLAYFLIPTTNITSVELLELPLDPFIIYKITIIGFVGGIVDTIAGVFEEMGFGTKSTSNLICTLTGALLGYFFF